MNLRGLALQSRHESWMRHRLLDEVSGRSDSSALSRQRRALLRCERAVPEPFEHSSHACLHVVGERDQRLKRGIELIAVHADAAVNADRRAPERKRLYHLHEAIRKHDGAARGVLVPGNYASENSDPSVEES